MSRFSMVLACAAATAALAGCAAGGGSAADDGDDATAEAGLFTTTAGTLFTDGNFVGDSFAIQVPTNGFEIQDDLPASFNDVASSLTVRSLCHVTLYVDAGAGGANVSYSANVNILPIGIDNAVSSYSAYCVPKCGTGKHWCGPDQGCTTQLCM